MKPEYSLIYSFEGYGDDKKDGSAKPWIARLDHYLPPFVGKLLKWEDNDDYLDPHIIQNEYLIEKGRIVPDYNGNAVSICVKDSDDPTKRSLHDYGQENTLICSVDYRLKKMFVFSEIEEHKFIVDFFKSLLD